MNREERRSRGAALAEEAKSYIEAHSAESFCLAKISRELYVNGNHLLRTFRQYTGMTPLRYHHLVRCTKAKELLSGTDLPIAQVGKKVGFVSSSHFSHLFLKTTGFTPSEYRRFRRADEQETAGPHPQR